MGGKKQREEAPGRGGRRRAVMSAWAAVPHGSCANGGSLTNTQATAVERATTTTARHPQHLSAATTHTTPAHDAARTRHGRIH